MIGTYTRKLVVAAFARSGEWCRTARLIWKGEPIPDGIAAEAKRERARHLARDGDVMTCDCAGCLFPNDTRARDEENFR